MIGMLLDLLLAALLLGAIAFGMRLNRRLKALRDSQTDFVAAATQLNQSLGRAETALAEMRAAGRDAEGALMERVDEARLMLKRLHEAMERTKAAPRPAAEAQARVTPLSAARLHARTDDELFEADESVPQMLARIRAAGGVR
jgi:hypothetical protein